MAKNKIKLKKARFISVFGREPLRLAYWLLPKLFSEEEHIMKSICREDGQHWLVVARQPLSPHQIDVPFRDGF